MRDDFRRHLQQFYAALHLAPPYDTAEKAIQALVASLQAMGSDERTALLRDETRRWDEYLKAFRAGGLHHKHRGIIVGLIRAGRTAPLSGAPARFLDAYRA